jgi:hypothetical protein
MVSLKIVKPTTDSEKVTRTVVDTIEITPAVVNAWIVPPFQRHLKINDKVRALAETIKGDGGVIPGVITLGVFERKQYLLDGQHRREAFLMSECQEGYVDIRQHHFDSMAEMGEEFVALNSQLVVMKPDDILRGLEGSCEALQIVRNACPWVGYDQVRRGARAPLLGMAMVMRPPVGPQGLGCRARLRSTLGRGQPDDLHVAVPAHGDHAVLGQDPQAHQGHVHQVPNVIIRRRTLRGLAGGPPDERQGSLADLQPDQGDLRQADRDRDGQEAPHAEPGMVEPQRSQVGMMVVRSPEEMASLVLTRWKLKRDARRKANPVRSRETAIRAWTQDQEELHRLMVDAFKEVIASARPAQ